MLPINAKIHPTFHQARNLDMKLNYIDEITTMNHTTMIDRTITLSHATANSMIKANYSIGTTAAISIKVSNYLTIINEAVIFTINLTDVNILKSCISYNLKALTASETF